MLSKPKAARVVLGLALLFVAVEAPTPALAGGPLSQMVSQWRARRQLRLPPVQEPFSTRPVKDISPSSLSSRFRNRFSIHRPDGKSFMAGQMFPRKDDGVARTSR